jgi:hypothetical protein
MGVGEMMMLEELYELYKAYDDEKKKDYFTIIGKVLSERRLKKRVLEIKELIHNKNIFTLSNDLLSIINSNDLKYDIVKYNTVSMSIKCDNDYNVEFISGSNMFIVSDKMLRFEVYDNSELYGVRKVVWERLEPELKDKYMDILTTICKYLVNGN